METIHTDSAYSGFTGKNVEKPAVTSVYSYSIDENQIKISRTSPRQVDFNDTLTIYMQVS
jgi:hypothetical protein